MGNQVSRVYGAVLKRPMQRFNVDHRAEKVIKKIEDPLATPMRAPMYKTDADLLEEIRKTKPEVADSAVKKDDELHDRLRSVFVTSKDPEIVEHSETSDDRPLPRDRNPYSYDFVPGHKRSEKTVPRGKVTLEQAVDLITKHKETEGTYDNHAAADQYRINPTVAENTMKYFQIFGMIEPKTRTSEYDQPDPLTAGVDWVEATKPTYLKTLEEQDKIKATIEEARTKAVDRAREERMLNKGNERT